MNPASFPNDDASDHDWDAAEREKDRSDVFVASGEPSVERKEEEEWRGGKVSRATKTRGRKRDEPDEVDRYHGKGSSWDGYNDGLEGGVTERRNDTSSEGRHWKEERLEVSEEWTGKEESSWLTSTAGKRRKKESQLLVFRIAREES